MSNGIPGLQPMCLALHPLQEDFWPPWPMGPAFSELCHLLVSRGVVERKLKSRPWRLGLEIKPQQASPHPCWEPSAAPPSLINMLGVALKAL